MRIRTALAMLLAGACSRGGEPSPPAESPPPARASAASPVPAPAPVQEIVDAAPAAPVVQAPPDAAPAPAEVVRILASKLAGEYHDNELKADSDYMTKQLEVYGTVGRVYRDVGGTIQLRLDEGVLCTCSDESAGEIAQLEPGQLVVVRGVGIGVEMRSPRLMGATVEWVGERPSAPPSKEERQRAAEHAEFSAVLCLREMGRANGKLTPEFDKVANESADALAAAGLTPLPCDPLPRAAMFSLGCENADWKPSECRAPELKAIADAVPPTKSKK